MGRPLAHLALRTCGWAAVLLGAMLAAALAAAPLAAAAQSADQSAPHDSRSLQEVHVTASKLDRRTLKRVAIQFVKLHGAASPVIDQIGRWQADVCPRVTGLNPAAATFVSRRVEAVARSVGAPTRGVGKRCAVNVEIVFTPEPQQLLNHIAKTYPVLLGSSRSAGDTTFRHAIQSWYLTGTREMEGWNPPADAPMLLGAVEGCTGCNGEAAGWGIQGEIDLALSQSLNPDGAHVDPAHGRGFAPSGMPGSYLTKSLTSELLHVLVIVDTRKVAGDSLRSIADYIAMLALTRMGSLDGCSELPSIIDLLSSGCDERDKPQALTDADTAYLKALYSSDLEMNLNIEQGDMRDRMVAAITGR
jgi:hypothetical protein